MRNPRFPRGPTLVALFAGVATLYSLSLVALDAPDALVVPLAAPCLWAAVFYGRRVYLPLSVIGAAAAIPVSLNVSTQLTSAIGAILGGGAVTVGLAEFVHTQVRRRNSSDLDFALALKQLGAVLRVSPIPMLIINFESGECLDANQPLLEMSQLRRDELIGNKTGEHAVWTDRRDRRRLVDELKCNGTVVDPDLVVRAHEGVRRILLAGTLLRLGGRDCVLWQSLDLTERLALHARLSQHQKMEAIGRLAGGIAHDFNNLLTAMLGYADLLKEGLQDDPESLESLAEIERSAQRGAALTHQLLTFSRRGAVEPVPVDAVRGLRELEPMLHRVIGENVSITAEVRDGELWTRLPPGQLEQVIVNLSVNARDAMPGGGRFDLHVDEVAVSRDTSLAHGNLARGQYVRIRVSDTGSGLDPETAQHMFEPFYTTKALGEGTGLGLATVYGIVQQAGGSLDVRSEAGSGTTIDVYLPRAEHGDARASERPEPPKPGRHSGTILVVEDAAPIRRLMHRVLSDAGFEVLEAENGAQALSILDSLDAPVRLVVTDVVMPDMGGPALARRVAQMPDPPPFLFVTGFAPESVLEGFESHQPVLQKPFTARDFARRVEAVLRES